MHPLLQHVAAILRPKAAPAAGPIATLIVSDTFDRADNATLGTATSGQAWTNAVNGWRITSNQAQPLNASGANIAVLDAGAANVRMQLTIAAVDTTSGHVLRYSDISHYLRVSASASASNVVVSEAGGAGTLATY